MFDSLTLQRENNRKGLGYVKKNPHNKYVTISDDLLCIYYGRDGHLKADCPSWKNAKQKKKSSANSDLMPKGKKDFNLKKYSLPCWTKNTLITPLSAYWESWLI